MRAKRLPPVLRTCNYCEGEFLAKASEVQRGSAKFCSYKCMYKGYHRPTGEEHGNWLGDKVGYTALHDWVRLHKGTPSECHHCGTTEAKKFEWANVSKEYKRDLDDWIRLCVSCHRKYDGHIYKAWETRRTHNV